MKNETLISKLPYDKVKIQWNKSPVRMDLFKSFLTIPVEKQTGHLGECTGWTKYCNDEHNLNIGGGIVNGVDYLDSIQYRKNLHNKYNNFCTPFHLKDVMTKEGISFFKEYYKFDIASQLINAKSEITRFENALTAAKFTLDNYELEVRNL